MLSCFASALLDVDSGKFYTCKCVSVSYIEGCLYSVFKYVNVQCSTTDIL